MVGRLIVAVGLLVPAGCGGGRGAAPLPDGTRAAPLAPTTSGTALPATQPPPGGVATSSTVPAVTPTAAAPGPAASFRAAGRTLLVRPSDRRKPYSQLGEQLPVPAGIQIEFGAPGATAVEGSAVPLTEWDSSGIGQPLDTSPTGEPGRWIWRASVPPGDYALEVTFTIDGGPVMVRAPVGVAG